MSIALQLQWCGHALITTPWWPSAHSQRSLYHDLSVAERPIRSLYRYILHVACCYMQDINPTLLS